MKLHVGIARIEDQYRMRFSETGFVKLVCGGHSDVFPQRKHWLQKFTLLSRAATALEQYLIWWSMGPNRKSKILSSFSVPY